MKPVNPIQARVIRARYVGPAVMVAVLLQGCTVLAVADVVGTVAVKTVGLAADAAIGVVKISGQAIGAAADAVTPDKRE